MSCRDRTHVRLPPPRWSPDPLLVTIDPGIPLLRIYNPDSRFRTRELTFRFFGPQERFDHHRASHLGHAQDDPVRGVWYGSDEDFACAVVEMFGDERIVELEPWRLARPSVVEPLRLLSLRAEGAMRAGTVAELGKTGSSSETWAWSRFFYEREDLYNRIDGMTWLGAFNDGKCVVLFERALSRLRCDSCSLPLSHPALRDPILRVVRDHNLRLSFKRLT